MTEIEIKNFQSIADIKFPIEGFTVIYGKNNIGKSAIIRAIKAALTNQTGKGFIKKGHKQTEIKIKKNDLELLWKKGPSAVYTINKKSYKKLNKDVPKPLIDAGFGKIEIGNKKVLPNLASQFKPLFLIDENGTTITDVLASFYNIDTLSTADDLCQKSLRAQKSLLKTREKDLLKIEEELEKYEDFDTIKKEVEDVLKKEKQINELESEISEIASFSTRIEQLSDSINKIKFVKEIKIPDISEHEKGFFEIETLKEFEREYTKRSEAIKLLKGINNISVPTTKEITLLSEEVNLLTVWYNQLKVLKEGIKQKRSLLKEIDMDKIKDSCNTIEKSYKELIALEEIEKEFMNMVVVAKSSRKNLRELTESYNEKYAVLSKEICPTCERPYGN